MRRLAESLAVVREVIRQPALRRAEVAFGAAWTGECAFTVGLGVIAFGDGGAATVGLVSLLRMLPPALTSPSLTALADRMRRERLLAAVSAIHATAAAGAAGVMALGGPAVGVYALAVLGTMAFILFRPVHSALLPTLCASVPQLTSANVARGLLDAFGALLGPALAGIVLAVGDATAIFGITAALSVVAAAVLLRIRSDAHAVHTPKRSLLYETAEGMRAVAANADLRIVVALGGAQTFVRGALSVLTVVVAFELLGTGDAGVGALSASVGAGGVVGSLGVSLLVGSRHLGAWLAVALVIWGAPIALMGVVPTEPLALGMLALVGVGNALIDVPLYTLPARFAEDAVLARVFGVFESLVALTVGLGAIVAPALIGLVGIRGALAVIGLILPSLAVATWRRLTALDRRLVVRDKELAVLRGTPMLGLLPVPTIEHLASRLRKRRLPAGATVFEEGDRGDAFFAVAEGRAEVVGDGVVVRTLGPGDAFGEIALLYDLPRTATVRAGSDLTVFELGRDTFLAGVTGYRTSTEAAYAAAASHLANYRPPGLTI